MPETRDYVGCIMSEIAERHKLEDICVNYNRNFLNVISLGWGEGSGVAWGTQVNGMCNLK